MSNPLFGQFGGQKNNGLQQLMAEAQRLSKTIQNPRQEVERLLQSGQMSQDDFNRFAQMANSLMGGMK